MQLHPEVETDLRDLIPWLAGQGFAPKSCEYDARAFGNYAVTFARNWQEIEIVRDRGQYLLGGDEQRIRSLGFWRALTSMQDLREAVAAYAGLSA